MGSVKDLVIFEKPRGTREGRAQFLFSDRYSVFDWGEMPDHIEGKGKSLAIISAYFFEKLERMGVRTHYLGLVEDGKLKRLSELGGPTDRMEIKLLRVLAPEIKEDVYDYSAYRREHANFLIPLEVIYRNFLPENSSVFKRLKKVSLPGHILEHPLLDVSTKLEASDRYINWEEARKLVGLSKKEVEEIKRITLLIDELISGEVKKKGLINEDGKVEFGFDEVGNLMVVDALGTLDECRFTFRGIQMSKEILRMFYRDTVWYHEVEKAREKDKIRWKKLVRISPPPLPERLKHLTSMLYRAFTNELTGRLWFENVLSLEEVLQEIQKDLKGKA